MNETDANAIFAPLWRRKWLILAVAVLVAAGSYLYYRGQTKLFSASTVIYLGAAAEEGVAGEKGTRSTSQSSATQVAVINSIVIGQVRQAFKRAGDPAATSKVSAKTKEKSQFITIAAESHTARGAARLANAVATAFMKRENAAHRRGINTAIEIARRQLRRIELTSAPAPTTKGGSGSGKSASPSTSSVLQQANLTTHINQLEAQLALPGAQQITPARPGSAQLLSPKPRQNAIFGFVIGLALASIFAYVLGRFDRRIRTLQTIESVFGVAVMTALPRVKRPIVMRDGAPAPSRNLLEALRGLQAGLKLRALTAPPSTARGNGASAAAPRAPRMILVTSADVGDGKSTLVADLALVGREAGERVAVIDANMRRPAQASLLGVDDAHGLAEVLMGRMEAEESMRSVGGATAGGGQIAVGGGTATAVGAGSISVLAGGAAGVSPPALLASEATAQLLASLSEEFDSVLIDAPSPLEVSDAMGLLSLVDGVLVVVRLNHTREPSAERLAQLLRDHARAPMLGVVANCASSKQIQRYGLSSANGRRWASTLFSR